MNDKFRVEFYQWFNDGLNVNAHFFDTAREAMNYAYDNADKWVTLKVYDPNGDLMHQNKSTAETYA
jgi:hypothetical protein